MKKLLVATFLMLFFFGISQEMQAQMLSNLDKSPLDMAYYPSRAAFRGFAKSEEEMKANEPMIRVIYSRPGKRDRKIFGDLVKFDEMWRAGANEATEILFLQDVTVNGTKVTAGRYTIHVMPTADNWTVHFNTDLDGWGSYKYDESKTVASITVPTAKTLTSVENFGIAFDKADDGAHMIMAWDDTMVRVPIQF